MKRKCDGAVAPRCGVRKKHSSEYFNKPISEEEAERFRLFVSAPQSPESVLAKFQERELRDAEDALQKSWIVHFERIGKPAMPIGFIECLKFCDNWLTRELRELGWKENKTGYTPFANSQSITMLIHGAMECFRIACKQLLRLHECGIL